MIRDRRIEGGMEGDWRTSTMRSTMRDLFRQINGRILETCTSV